MEKRRKKEREKKVPFDVKIYTELVGTFYCFIQDYFQYKDSFYFDL